MESAAILGRKSVLSHDEGIHKIQKLVAEIEKVIVGKPP